MKKARGNIENIDIENQSFKVTTIISDSDYGYYQKLLAESDNGIERLIYRFEVAEYSDMDEITKQLGEIQKIEHENIIKFFDWSFEEENTISFSLSPIHYTLEETI